MRRVDGAEEQDARIVIAISNAAVGRARAEAEEGEGRHDALVDRDGMTLPVHEVLGIAKPLDVLVLRLQGLREKLSGIERGDASDRDEEVGRGGRVVVVEALVDGAVSGRDDEAVGHNVELGPVIVNLPRNGEIRSMNAYEVNETSVDKPDG